MKIYPFNLTRMKMEKDKILWSNEGFFLVVGNCCYCKGIPSFVN